MRGNKGKKGKNNTCWKGEKAKYSAIHMWMKRNHPTPKKCEFCGIVGVKIQWSNKDHKYSRKLKDWMHLCRSCHYYYDKRQKQLNCVH